MIRDVHSQHAEIQERALAIILYLFKKISNKYINENHKQNS